MTSNVNYFPECYADTALISFLDVNKKQIKHQKSIGNVNKAHKTYSQNTHLTILALIDGDKNFQDFEYLNSWPIQFEKEYYSIRKHAKAFHYALVVKPAFEKFILNLASEIQINPMDFKLPTDPEIMHNLITTDLEVAKNQQFRSFVKKILYHPQYAYLRNFLLDPTQHFWEAV
jgi:hypothetical protein